VIALFLSNIEEAKRFIKGGTANYIQISHQEFGFCSDFLFLFRLFATLQAGLQRQMKPCLLEE
jgi:hypothetical protein